MEIKNPRRILCLGPPESGVLTLLKDLTGSSPTPRTLPPTSPSPSSTTASPEDSTPRTTTAGTSHALPLKTPYYSATIPIWLDETTDPATWATDFLTPDAGEVIRAVGAWIVVFRNRSLFNPQPDDASQHVQTRTWSRKDISATLTSIKAIIAHAHNDDFAAWDGTCLAIGMPGGAVSSLADSMASVVDETALKEQWEDECFEAGFEYVDCTREESTTRNELGELTGLARVREALEAVEWEDLSLGDEGEVDDVFGEESEGVEEDAGFRMERHELEREFVGLKMDMAATGEHDEDGLEEGMAEEEQDVEQLDAMLRKMLAVKEMSGHLTEVERQRMARKVVGEVMGDEAFQL